MTFRFFFFHFLENNRHLARNFIGENSKNHKFISIFASKSNLPYHGYHQNQRQVFPTINS